MTVAAFDYEACRARAARSSRLDLVPGLDPRWKVAAWHYDDENGFLVTIGAAMSGEPYREGTIYVSRAGALYWGASVDARGRIVDADGRVLEPM